MKWSEVRTFQKIKSKNERNQVEFSCEVSNFKLILNLMGYWDTGTKKNFFFRPMFVNKRRNVKFGVFSNTS